MPRAVSKLSVEVRDGVKLAVTIDHFSRDKTLVMTHGIGEHLGRHEHLVDWLSNDYNIVRYDLRGHGQSGGEPASIKNFADFAIDLKELLEFLKKEQGLKEFVLMGHSMGSLITAQCLKTYLTSDLYPSRVFLSAPLIEIPGPEGLLVFGTAFDLPAFLAKMPEVKLGGLVPLSALSHDLQVAKDYETDPSNHLKLSTRLVFKMLSTARKVFASPLRVRCPLDITVGSKDKIVSSKAILRYFGEIEKNGNVHVVEGGYHELHNEIEPYRSEFIKILKEALCS